LNRNGWLTFIGIYNIEHIPDYVLNIEIGTTFFRFAIKQNERFIALEEYNYTDRLVFIKELFNQHAYLSTRFWKEINLIVYSTKKTMVPAFIEDIDAKNIWTSLFGNSSKNESISTFKLDGNTLIFNSNPSITSFFIEFYTEKKLNIFPIEAALDKIKRKAVFHFDGVGCTAYIKGQSYYHKDWKTMQELCISDSLILTGEITKYALDYRSMMAANIKTEMAVLDEKIHLSPIFNELPPHRYFIIFSI
jgi:hypothetical protein